jgi:hypothetical protein
MAAFVLMLLLINMTACNSHKKTVEYGECEWSKTYYYGENEAITCYATYPVLEDARYEELNRAIIEHELKSWEKIFGYMCEKFDEDVAIDPDMLEFRRYFEVSYKLETDGEGIVITFDVKWLATLSNREESYTRTYSLVDGAVYSTTTVSERVY